MTQNRWHLFLCNGAEGGTSKADEFASKRRLEYRLGHPDRNVNFAIPTLVRQLQHLPDRALDLLEIASYIYCADRSVSRGSKSDAVYSSWTQSVALRVKVRDYIFWSRAEVGEALIEALHLMSGLNFRFDFEAGHSTPPAGLFDNPGVPRKPQAGQVILFSGGIDSLTGVCQAIRHSGQPLYLVSHRSQNIAFRTQNQLYKALSQREPAGRIRHIVFPCNLMGERAREETQRTRFFLYSALAFSVTGALDTSGFYVFENGITSLNLPKSQQMMNARNSRTTHPQTLQAMDRFLSLVAEGDFHIYNPFAWMTKAEVVGELVTLGYGDYLSSSVSCSRTFDEGVRDVRPHCGRCSQCIDRRIAIYGAEAEEYDNEDLYVRDFITQDVGDSSSQTLNSDAITLLKDYLRQAASFHKLDLEDFYKKWLDDLAAIAPVVSADEEVAVGNIYSLCQRHGRATMRGVQRMRLKEDLTQPVTPNSLLQILSDRNFLDGQEGGETGSDITARLKEQLRACPTGKDDFAQFEKVGVEILRHLFPSALGSPMPQRTTTDGSQRRDVLFRNNRTTRLFQRLFDKFAADFIIVDFKNNGKPVGPKEVDGIAKYANKALGYFILLVSRFGPAETAKPVQERVFRDDDKARLWPFEGCEENW